MSSDDYSDHEKHEDLKVLHGMGYAQELQRSMSKFSNFAISFSIICILSGGINSFAQAIGSVGGAGAGIGWIVGAALSGMFALSMAQISSAFPTAGGLYHWGSILGNRFWGWLTAWLNLLGLITVLGAINIGTAYFFTGTFGSMFGFTGTDWQIVGFVAVITVIQAIFNHIGIKATTFLTDISGYIIFATTAVLVIACLWFAPPSTSRGSGPSPTSRARPAATSSRNPTTSATSSCFASSCRSIPSPATTPRPIPPRKPRTPRIRCRAASSRRCSGRPSSAGS
jgi:amino acid transporter